MNSNVNQYFLEGCGRCPLGATPACKVHSWTVELETLREILLDSELTEELKWGVPCYTFQKKNILLLSAFKKYCAIGFFKGVLLNRCKDILEKPGANSQASRLIKFTNLEQITKLETEIKICIKEAIEVEKSGLKVNFKKNPEPMPEELLTRLEDDAIFKTAFEALTKGRQRGYILYFAAPKQSKTRIARIEKSISKILNGEGLNDKYSLKK